MSAMAMPDSPTLPFRLQKYVLYWAADPQPRPRSCLPLPMQQCPWCPLSPLHSPDAHRVLHSGFLFISHLGCISPTAAPPSLKQLQAGHWLGVGPWVVSKLIVFIVLIVLVCLHCAGVALWFRTQHQSPQGPAASNPSAHSYTRHGP